MKMRVSKAEGVRRTLTVACLGWPAAELAPFERAMGSDTRLSVIFADCTGVQKGALSNDERESLATVAAHLALDLVDEQEAEAILTYCEEHLT